MMIKCFTSHILSPKTAASFSVDKSTKGILSYGLKYVLNAVDKDQEHT